MDHQRIDLNCWATCRWRESAPAPQCNLPWWMLLSNSLLFLTRNFNSDFLSCDCGLRWVPGYFRTRTARRLGDETICAYPRNLHGKPLRGLRESQLSCGECLTGNVMHMNEVVRHYPPSNSMKTWVCEWQSHCFLIMILFVDVPNLLGRCTVCEK